MYPLLSHSFIDSPETDEVTQVLKPGTGAEVM